MNQRCVNAAITINGGYYHSIFMVLLLILLFCPILPPG